ncbi:hypothetical protein [Robertkochia solimangrovi]|uniref:hypothetical protein n=1 Tax=Robertkochia solimangrovi TaxID=2213046 RepID=UPI00117FEEB6|nr:hypothetical protein [Robertkochia solimangrovi]TRZ45043.1 hypothetical protein DMZ48_04595 [Robertkochia solimangrovi]
MASIQTIIEAIRQPVTGNKRLWKVITLALVVIGMLGFYYYSIIEQNAENLKKFKFQQLDTYFQMASMKIENDILIHKALNKSPESKSKALLSQNQFQQIQYEKLLFSAFWYEGYSEMKKNLDSIKQYLDTNKKAYLKDLAIQQGKEDTYIKEDSLKNSMVLSIKNNLKESMINDYLKDEFEKYCITLTFETDSLNKINNEAFFKPFIISEGIQGEEITLRKENDSTLSSNLGIVQQWPVKDPVYQVFQKTYLFESELQKDFRIHIEVTALMPYKKFLEANRKLSPWVLIFLSALLILCLLGLPYFKLRYISEDERIFSKDVVAAGATTMVGAFMLFIITITLLRYQYAYYYTIPSKLGDLNNEIRYRFNRENENVIKKLYELKLPINILRSDSSDVLENTLFNKIDYQGLYLPLRLDSLKVGYNMKYLTIIDDSAWVKKSYNVLRKPMAKPWKLNNRSYYQDFVLSPKKNVWLFKDKLPYVMRTVVSMQDNREEAVYIIQEEPEYFELMQSEPVYRVGSIQLGSLQNTILPQGYQFAVIDPTGEVWFHSEKNRSTLENFYDTSLKNDNLKAAINSRIDTRGRIYYRNGNYFYHVSPIMGTNLSLITLYDQNLLRFQLTESLSFSFLMILVIFLFIAILSMITVRNKKRKLKLSKFTDFRFEFLVPKKPEEEDYKEVREFSNPKYLKLAFFFFIISLIILLLNFMAHFEFDTTVISSVLIITWSYIIVYHSMQQQSKGDNFVHIIFFLVVLFLNVLLCSTIEGVLGYLGLILLQMVFVFFILVNGFNEELPSESEEGHRLQHKKWYEKVIDHVCSNYTFPRDFCNRSCVKLIKRYAISLQTAYQLFLFSWLLIGVIVPAFVIHSKNMETNNKIWIRANQYFTAENYLAKYQDFATKLPQRVSNTDTYQNDLIFYNDFRDYHMRTGLYLPDNSEIIYDTVMERQYFTKEIIPNVSSDAGITVHDLFWHYKPVFNKKEYPVKPFAYETAGDSIWFSTAKGNKSEVYVRVLEGKVFATAADTRPGINSVVFILWELFIFGMMMLGIYNLIGFYVNRFFGIRFMYLKPVSMIQHLPDSLQKKRGDPAETMNIKSRENALVSIIKQPFTKNGGSIIVGPPFTDKNEVARKVLAATGSNPGIYSFLNLYKVSNEDLKVRDIDSLLDRIKTADCPKLEKSQVHFDSYILQNLEYNSFSSEINRFKLKVILHLLSLKRKIIITSEMYPSQLMDLYDDDVVVKETIKSNNLFDQASDFQTWRNILGAFPQFIAGITENKAADFLPVDEFKAISALKWTEQGLDLKNKHYERDISECRETIRKELDYGNFLPGLTISVFEKTFYVKFGRLYLNEERMILHTQNLAHGYYTDIWNSLPTRERYMLYDLAKDNFLNTKNSHSLFSLMKKGLIVWKDRPVIFNRSFRNFVATSVSINEAMRLQFKNNKGKDTWNTMRIVIYLIIIAVSVFILLGEPDLIKDFEALIGTLGGLGVIIPFISSMLSRGGQRA